MIIRAPLFPPYYLSGLQHKYIAKLHFRYNTNTIQIRLQYKYNKNALQIWWSWLFFFLLTILNCLSGLHPTVTNTIQTHCSKYITDTLQIHHRYDTNTVATNTMEMGRNRVKVIFYIKYECLHRKQLQCKCMIQIEHKHTTACLACIWIHGINCKTATEK